MAKTICIGAKMCAVAGSGWAGGEANHDLDPAQRLRHGAGRVSAAQHFGFRGPPGADLPVGPEYRPASHGRGTLWACVCIPLLSCGIAVFV